jgi:D-alanyl-D-alanine dipeptidase
MPRFQSSWPATLLWSLALLLSFLGNGCGAPAPTSPDALTRQAILERKKAALERFRRIPVHGADSGLAADMQRRGLVNVQEMDPHIQVQLAYATAENFLDTPIYGALNQAYLLLEAAAMLSMAQDELSRRKPGYRLLVYDAARPVHVQRAMWSKVQGTPQARYVANPDRGSLHNYGAAVDLSIADANGQPLDMGTPFDHFGDLAQPRYEERFRRSGQLSKAQLANRNLLRDVMHYGGFSGIPNEWWHFNAFSIKHVRENYTAIE